MQLKIVTTTICYLFIGQKGLHPGNVDKLHLHLHFENTVSFKDARDLCGAALENG